MNVYKSQQVSHEGRTYKVTATATLGDGTRVAQIRPVGQHAGGAWVKAEELVQA